MSQEKPYLFDLLNVLVKSGAAYDLYASGLLSDTYSDSIAAYKIYREVFAETKKKMFAYQYAADSIGRPLIFVIRAVKKFETYKPKGDGSLLLKMDITALLKQ